MSATISEEEIEDSTGSQRVELSDEERKFKGQTPFPNDDAPDLPIEDYTPWDDSYSLGVNVISASILMAWFGYYFDAWLIEALVLSAIGASSSMFLYKMGATREFGKSFEVKWVKSAQDAFEGTDLTIGHSRMTRGGDIDLMVLSANQTKINVEIKSWRSWNKDERNLRREKKALSQIHMQRGAIDAFASVLWLPQGSESLFETLFSGNNKIDEDIYLCRGNARKLRRLIRQIAKKSK